MSMTTNNLPTPLDRNNPLAKRTADLGNAFAEDRTGNHLRSAYRLRCFQPAAAGDDAH
jgi:hypothetical protein